MKKQNLAIVIVLIALAVIFVASYYFPAPIAYSDRDELREAIPDLQACTQDSDCTLVKDCPDLCQDHAVNKKYVELWENTPLSEEDQEQCVVRGANPLDTCAVVDFFPSCHNNNCVAIGE